MGDLKCNTRRAPRNARKGVLSFSFQITRNTLQAPRAKGFRRPETGLLVAI